MNTLGASVPSSRKAPNYRADRFPSTELIPVKVDLGSADGRPDFYSSSGERRGMSTRAENVARRRADFALPRAMQDQAGIGSCRKPPRRKHPVAGIASRLARFIPSPIAFPGFSLRWAWAGGQAVILIGLLSNPMRTERTRRKSDG